MMDVAIIGGGPAALTAALYLARAGKRAQVFERRQLGGALSEAGQISNYPGFTGSSAELAEKFRHQAEQAGAVISYGECTAVQPAEGGFELTIDGEKITAPAVLAASGSAPRKLDFDPSVPVSYCTLCEGELARGKNVAVIGGANSAAHSALYLAPLASQLTLITHSTLKADPVLIEKLHQHTNVAVREGVEPTAELLNDFDFVFVNIGRQPASEYLQDLPGVLDDSGYVITSTGAVSANGEEYPHQTKIPGLFAAGDVRQGTLHQVISAAGDGASAAVEITRFLPNS